MSALKFDVLDLIREPDNYTSGERAQAAEAIAELISAATEAFDAPDVAWTIASTSERLADRLAAALARFGGAE